MEAVRDRALGEVARQTPHLPGGLGRYVKDWVIVDSTTVKLDARLKDVYPGAGEYAAVKVHKRFSVGVGTVMDYHLSPAREQDAPPLTVDATWRGLGLLADLGYASLRLLLECETHGVQYVIRLKESWKPRVDAITRGTVKRALCRGADFDLLLEKAVLRLDGKVIDARVQVGRGAVTVACRLVRVPGPNGYCFYLTHLPGAIGPRQIADLYRVRWEIESHNKLDKSCLQLDAIGARTAPAVRALIHASLIGSVIIGLLAYHPRRREDKAAKAGAERKTAPIHPQFLARAVGCAAVSIAAAMELKGVAAETRWRELAHYLTHLGRAPNWRHRPSILDQLQGWRITPGRPRRARTASVAHLAAN